MGIGHWVLGIGQIYEHKTIHLELADSYIQISFKEAIHMGFKSLSAIILQKSKLQYSIEVFFFAFDPRGTSR